GRQRAGEPKENQQRLAADAIRQAAIDRLQQGREDQRAEDHEGGLVLGQADREPDEGLHVGGESIERRGASGGEADDKQQLARIFQKSADRAGRFFQL